MIFIPYRNFYEFIPKNKEIDKEAVDNSYRPATVLMSELKENQIYELVVTNFHGGPFWRYRIGDYLKVISLKDIESGLKLPQFVLCPRPGRRPALTV